MSSNLLHRLGDAWNLIKKGSVAPFDRIPVVGGGAGEDLRQPYKNSVWVQRAIKTIAEPIASVPLKFRDVATEKEITSAPWSKFWSKPALKLRRGDFIEGSVGWLKLSGECFWLMGDAFRAPFPEAQTSWPQLVLARPDAMRFEELPDGTLRWFFTDSRGKRYRLNADQVVQPKFWNPYDDNRGMSEYEAAQVASESDYLSGRFALNIARANGDTGQIVTAKGQMPDEGQRKMITDALREKRRKALAGEFSTVFVPGDIAVEDPKIKAPDAAFVATRLENRHEIFIAFGVPPSMADVSQSYSIGSASDFFRLIFTTCIPTSTKLAEHISEIVTLQNGGNPVEAYFDWDEHPVVQQVRRERIDAGTKLWDRGMPWDEVSEYLDLDLPKFKGSEKGFLPFGIAPVDATFDPSNDPALNEDAPEKPAETTDEILQDMRRVFQIRSGGASVPASRAPGCGCDLHQLAADRPAAEVALWKKHMLGRAATVKSYRARFDRSLLKVRAEVLRKLEAPGVNVLAALGRAGTAVHFLFNQSAFKADLFALMKGAHENALESAGKQLFAEVGKKDPFKMAPESVLQFVRDRENRLAGVPEEVFDRIKTQLDEGLNAGDTMKQLASRVRAEFNDISDGRAKVIAQTETAAAYGTGRNEAMKQAGVQFKKWLTSGNANVRAGHRIANGQIVAIDEPFLVESKESGTEELMHPGDPNGSPDNVINCHCVSIAVAAPDGGVEES